MDKREQKEIRDELSFNILIVEDEKADALLLKKAFYENAAIDNINIAIDGEQALDYLRGTGEYSDRKQHPLPNLIMLDLKLPKISGLQALQEIKAMEIIKRIPVVVLSASDQIKDIRDAYDLGANSYFVKKVGYSHFISIAEQINKYWLEYNQQPPLSD